MAAGESAHLDAAAVHGSALRASVLRVFGVLVPGVFLLSNGCAKRGKSASSASPDSGDSGVQASSDSGDSSAGDSGLDSADSGDSGGTDDPLPRLEGALDGEAWAMGDIAGAELGARVVWAGERGWVSAPGGGGVVLCLPDGPGFRSEVANAHLGAALTPFGDGVLAGVWATEDGGEGEGAVYLLPSDGGSYLVEADLQPVFTFDDGAVGLVLAGLPTSVSSSVWALGRPKGAGNAGLVTLLSVEDHAEVSNWTGTRTGDLAGGAVAQLDFNGDGVADFAAGAWGASSFAGSVQLVEGPFVAEGSFADADRTWVGDAWALAGYTLAVGDVDGDGTDDLVVGSFGDPRNGTGAGALTVVPGGSSGGFLLDQDAHRLGAAVDAHFSRGLALSDIDLDGFADIAAGGPDRAEGGTAELFYGPIEGVETGGDAQLIDAEAGAGDGFGTSMDLDVELGWLVGAPGAGGGTGRVLWAPATLRPPLH